MRKKDSSQKLFFEELKKEFPANHNMARWLGETLSLDLSNAYRRIRGEHALQFDELHALARHFPQALGVLTRNWSGQNASWFEPLPLDSWAGIHQYLGIILQILKISRQKGHRVMHFTREIPLYLLCYDPRLLKAILAVNKADQFSWQHRTPEPIVRLLREVREEYQQSLSMEIWHQSVLDNFQSVLSRKAITGELSRHIHQIILGILKSAIADLEANFPPALKLYITNCELMDECLFSSRDLPKLRSYLLHRRVELSNSGKEWLNMKTNWHNQLNHSLEISGSSAAARELFFNTLHERLIRWMAGRSEERDSLTDF